MLLLLAANGGTPGVVQETGYPLDEEATSRSYRSAPESGHYGTSHPFAKTDVVGRQDQTNESEQNVEQAKMLCVLFLDACGCWAGLLRWKYCFQLLPCLGKD